MPNGDDGAGDIDWEYLSPVFLQDLKYGLVLFEALGDPADLPLPLVRIFDKVVSADAWEDCADEDAAARCLIEAQELLDEALNDPSLAAYWEALDEARRNLRIDLILARKAIEPTWVSDVEGYLGVQREDDLPELLPLFRAAELTDHALSDVAEMTGIRLMAGHVRELLLRGHDSRYTQLAALDHLLTGMLPEPIAELDYAVNRALGLPIEGAAVASWQISQDEIEPLRAMQEAVRQQESTLARLQTGSDVESPTGKSDRPRS